MVKLISLIRQVYMTESDLEAQVVLPSISTAQSLVLFSVKIE